MKTFVLVLSTFFATSAFAGGGSVDLGPGGGSARIKWGPGGLKYSICVDKECQDGTFPYPEALAKAINAFLISEDSQIMHSSNLNLEEKTILVSYLQELRSEGFEGSDRAILVSLSN
jgi:hypothetical protein